ncbi:hypothetical protein ACR9WD_00860 [Glutamicibacter sp. PAEs-4]|uniref:hypothetical protein n=1 Tax=unclassified Glutamicibacter TaxID=2627139 RepID=UPI00093C134A|nr:hypothetical protein [Glutamicibacter sp. 0426]
MLKFFGITTGAPAGGKVRAWQGVDRKHRGIAFAVSLVLASAAFLAARWLLSGLPPEHSLPYVPWLAAAALLLISTLVAERSMISNQQAEAGGI